MKIKIGGKGMATKKSHQPLLYIKQPTFDEQMAPMQQFFMNRKPIQEEQADVNQNQAAIRQDNESNLIINPVSNENLIEPLVNQISLLEEESDSNVMEFMLEAILNPFTTQNIDTDLEFLEEVQNNNFSLIHEDKNNSIVKNTEVMKNALFNDLPLENKLIQLRKMPSIVVKFLYEFVTAEETYKGYYLTTAEGYLIVQPQDKSESINITEHSIIDINIVGF